MTFLEGEAVILQKLQLDWFYFRDKSNPNAVTHVLNFVIGLTVIILKNLADEMLPNIILQLNLRST